MEDQNFEAVFQQIAGKKEIATLANSLAGLMKDISSIEVDLTDDPVQDFSEEILRNFSDTTPTLFDKGSQSLFIANLYAFTALKSSSEKFKDDIIDVIKTMIIAEEIKQLPETPSPNDVASVFEKISEIENIIYDYLEKINSESGLVDLINFITYYIDAITEAIPGINAFLLEAKSNVNNLAFTQNNVFNTVFPKLFYNLNAAKSEAEVEGILSTWKNYVPSSNESLENFHLFWSYKFTTLVNSLTKIGFIIQREIINIKIESSTTFGSITTFTVNPPSKEIYPKEVFSEKTISTITSEIENNTPWGQEIKSWARKQGLMLADPSIIIDLLQEYFSSKSMFGVNFTFVKTVVNNKKFKQETGYE